MRALAGILALLLVGACQSAPGGGTAPRTGGSVIAQEELEALPALTVLQAIERLRPSWLRGRVTTVRGATRARYFAYVFVDRVPTGDLEVLGRMNAMDVREIRFLSASDATTRYGTGYPGGIIEVFTKGN
jgi:hypothetical protein